MKTHAIIPIFVPHAGCPHDCIFCDQKAITARAAAPDADATVEVIERNLKTIDANPDIIHREIAFYGGSFTAIPREEQLMYLGIAKKYKDAGRVDSIHLSTRPDYIDETVLNDLKNHGVDIIELGVQSFDTEVLRLSARGHDVETVYRSTEMIKEWGFTLGIQLMIGLPGDSYEKCMESVRKTIDIGPAIARIYPTVIIRDTGLDRLYRAGKYELLAETEAVRTAKDMYKALTGAGINVIRVGLKATDNIKEEGGSAVAGFHPAFRQLVEAEIAREQIEQQLGPLLDEARRNGKLPAPGAGSMKLRAVSGPGSFSNMIGNKKSNKIYFAENYPQLDIKFAVDRNMAEGTYNLIHFTESR